MEEFITTFKDYRDLPFSKEIQDELFNRHDHTAYGEIVYHEKDVLILLQMLKREYEEVLKPFADLSKQFDGVIRNRVKDGIAQGWSHPVHGEMFLTVEMLNAAKQIIIE